MSSVKAPTHFDAFLLIPITIFSLLFLPFINTIPYLDGNIDFVQTYDFSTGGFHHYFTQWQSVHPPFKLWLADIFYSLLGIHAYSYNIIGFLAVVLGIVAIYYLVEAIAGRLCARVSTMLLAISPLFISASMFYLRDFLLAVFVLSSLWLYSQSKYTLYAIVGSALVLTKETGLLLPVIVFSLDLVYMKKVFSEKGRVEA